jgi:hypothetical protein
MGGPVATETELFNDFARRWLVLQSEAFADCMVELMLRGPIGRVPVKFRPLAKALRVIRDGGVVKARRR